MSDIFHNFDSNSIGNNSSTASPSLSTQMAASTNTNSAIQSTSGANHPNSTPGATGAACRSSNAADQPILTKARLQELVREVDPNAQLDEDVEELLMQLADDFVDDAVKTSCNFAKHRKASKVDVRDAQLYLERKWNMWIPGFGTDELRPYKRAAVTEAHKQRLALIRKTVKKY